MILVIDMWAWVKDNIEPLKREIKGMREKVGNLKHENAERDVAIEKLKA